MTKKPLIDTPLILWCIFLILTFIWVTQGEIKIRAIEHSLGIKPTECISETILKDKTFNMLPYMIGMPTSEMIYIKLRNSILKGHCS